MKEGTFITKLVMILLAAGLAAYFGVYLWRGMTDPMTTTLAYTYTVSDGVETDGFLVREEQVLPARSGITDVVLREGEKVGASQTVAVLYRDSTAVERKDQIQALEMEIELLQYAMTQTDETASAAELEGDVIRAVTGLRGSTAAGDFTRLEDQVLALKQAVLKRDYTYGGVEDTARLAELSSQLRTLRSQSAQDTSRVTASQAGTFSAQVDGYESLLTPQSAASLTPSQLEALSAQTVRGDENAVGKLITSSKWYFVTALEEKTAGRLTPGKTVTVRFTGDFDQDVDMLVESISPAEGGQVVVLLSSTRYLSSTTLLRQQTVELVFEQYEGLRVPKSAVHILTREVKDKETGETTQVSVTGVYAVVNGQAEFKEVETLAQGTEFYVVRPLGSEKTALRAGDEIIVRAKGLYDGKIVR